MYMCADTGYCEEKEKVTFLPPQSKGPKVMQQEKDQVILY